MGFLDIQDLTTQDMDNPEILVKRISDLYERLSSCNSNNMMNQMNVMEKQDRFQEQNDKDIKSLKNEIILVQRRLDYLLKFYRPQT